MPYIEVGLATILNQEKRVIKMDNKKQKYVLIILVIIGVIAIGSYSIHSITGHTIGRTSKTQDVTVMMPFPPLSIWAPFYTALDKGYYEKEGLNVNILHSNEGSMGSIKQVVSDNAQFGYAGVESIVLARSKDMPVIAIYKIEQRQPFRIIAKKETGIAELNDLVGKKFATPSFGSSAYIIDRIMLHKAGVDYNKIDFIPTGAMARLPSFLQNKVDAMDSHLIYEIILNLQNKPINVIQASDYTNMPGIQVITSEKMIKENPELVEKFVRATKKGLVDAIDNPEGAIDSFIEFSPEAAEKKEFNLALWKKHIDEILLDENGQIPNGKFSYNKWAEAQNELDDVGLLDKKTPVSEMYTNKFLPN
ncbi:MAG: hypothetical protein DRN66_03375 [Candidatus Nanohalarchaeota archaeon]|nr:MAG: hypothetical protein DRN66_03375 [Candidatus Nanohaloarchaeota archaeon]